MLPASECAEQRMLREKYKAALKTYWEMVPTLDIASTHLDFEEAYERAEGVRLLFARAKTELMDHIRQHGCEIAGEASSTA
jgi:hypothetical protein